MAHRIENKTEINYTDFQILALASMDLTPESVLKLYDTSAKMYSTGDDFDLYFEGAKELYTSDRDVLVHNVKVCSWQIMYMTFNKPDAENPQTLAPLLLSSFVDFDLSTRLEEIDNIYLSEILGTSWFINNESLNDVIEEGWIIVDGVNYILSYPDGVLGELDWTVIS